jgi:hypothetical protein
MIQNPGDLRAAEIGIEQKARLGVNHRLTSIGSQSIADGSRPPILPHDRAMDWLAGRAIPDDNRFTLVRDANRRDIGHLQFGAC